MSENPVWSGTIDQGSFDCRVMRSGDDPDYTGVLTVRHVASGEVLLTENVFLSYSAIFGPDAGDVADWQHRVIEVIDAWLASHPT